MTDNAINHLLESRLEAYNDAEEARSIATQLRSLLEVFLCDFHSSFGRKYDWKGWTKNDPLGRFPWEVPANEP